jgi:hypothetical protein
VSVNCWSNGIAANMIPLSPPMMKKTMKPRIHNSGVLKIGLPVTSVVIHANS